jgi:hypothetical protein
MLNKMLFISCLVAILLSISGCPSSAEETAPITAHSSGEPGLITLSLSHAPKLGETAELICTNKIGFFRIQNSTVDKSNIKVKAWIEFFYANTKGSYSEAKHGVLIPYDKVLVNGQLDWEGNPFSINGTLELGGTIQLPREGIWEITGYMQAEGLDNTWMEQTFKAQIRIAVTQDVAAAYNTREFYDEGLAYLTNFSYGGISHRVPNEIFDPVVLELDISKIPGTGEEATLTCCITSLYDVTDFSARITFYKRLEDYTIVKIQEDKVLVNGYLRWAGDLIKGEPITFSALITLPDEGDWQIYASGDYPTNERIGFSDIIELNISGNIRSYGWEERPIENGDTSELPPTPTPSH